MTKSIIKVALTLALIFSSTFIIVKAFGVMTVSDIKEWFSTLQTLPAYYTAILVVSLLFADLFIAVPTLTVTILSGYFLGPLAGGFAALIGMCFAGVTGYWLCRWRGEKILKVVLKDSSERDRLRADFERQGIVMILTSRAVPILPEVTACLSGLTNMPFKKFLFAWLANSIPYAFVGSYAGSQSTLSNPTPALITGAAITLFLWGATVIVQRRRK